MVLLPGIEGLASLLGCLAENLVGETFCLQYGFDNRNETVEDMTIKLLNVGKTRQN